MTIDKPRLRLMIAEATKHICKLNGLDDVVVDVDVELRERQPARVEIQVIDATHHDPTTKRPWGDN